MRVSSITDDAFSMTRVSSVHSGRAAVANHADHSGVAAVVHGGIQTALVNQPLLVEVLLDLASGPCSPTGCALPLRAFRPADLCQRDSDIHRLSSRGGEPLDHDVVGPGREGPTKPVAALVAPVHLHLAALEIDGAQIVLDRRGLRKIEAHQECRNCGVRIVFRLMGPSSIFWKANSTASRYFPSSTICRTCGNMSATLGAS